MLFKAIGRPDAICVKVDVLGLQIVACLIDQLLNTLQSLTAVRSIAHGFWTASAKGFCFLLGTSMCSTMDPYGVIFEHKMFLGLLWVLVEKASGRPSF